jgi:glycosyltransferase involved in cell wall biosynthesis
MNIKSKSLLINQITNININPFNEIESINRIISFKEKGLSRSRNNAIINSNGEICLLADDDIRYDDNYIEIVNSAYTKYKDADIIAFFVDGEGKNKKRIIKKSKIGLIYSMKLMSVQISFKKRSIIESQILFDQNFGAGTSNFMGEENIFLSDCLKKGLKIYYYPVKIGTIFDNSSSWFTGYNKKYFNVLGLVYRRIFPKIYPLIILQYAIRKYKLFRGQVTFIEAIKYMFEKSCA